MKSIVTTVGHSFKRSADYVTSPNSNDKKKIVQNLHA